MNFILEQPMEKGFDSRVEFSGDAVQLVTEGTAKTAEGRGVKRFTFQASKKGGHSIRLLESPEEPQGAKPDRRALRKASYTVIVS